MKGFIDRLGLVIHWCAFLIGASFFMVGMFMGFTTSGGAEIFFAAPFVWFAIWGTGWLIRYLMVGTCKSLPWETL
jgi:hypothetical protein